MIYIDKVNLKVFNCFFYFGKVVLSDVWIVWIVGNKDVVLMYVSLVCFDKWYCVIGCVLVKIMVGNGLVFVSYY